MNEGFIEALVGFLEVDIFADNGNACLVERLFQGMDQFFPGFQDGRASPHIEQLQDLLIQTFLVVEQRHLVDAFHIVGRDHGIPLDIAEMSNLGFDVGRQRMFRAAEQNIRLNTDASKFFDAVLGGFGLELARGFHIRHQGDVNVDRMVSADIVSELANSLQEGQAFDIADRPADLHDDDIHIVGHAADAGFDLVGDMRDHLNGATEIIAAAFFGNDRIVYAAGGVVVLAGPSRHE